LFNSQQVSNLGKKHRKLVSCVVGFKNLSRKNKNICLLQFVKLTIVMETIGISCYLCSAVTKTSSDMEVHIFTNHADIFKTVSVDKKSDESIPDRPDRKKDETPERTDEKKEEYPHGESPEMMEPSEKPKSEAESTKLDLTTEMKFGLVIIEGNSAQSAFSWQPIQRSSTIIRLKNIPGIKK